MDIKMIENILGKTIRSVKDLSRERVDKFQIMFTDNSIMIVESHAEGYEVENETLEVHIYEE